jgi:hypothetical protein
LLVLQDGDSQGPREATQGLAHLRKAFGLEFCKNAQDEIGIVDWFRCLRDLLGNGVSFHGQSSNPSSSELIALNDK